MQTTFTKKALLHGSVAILLNIFAVAVAVPNASAVTPSTHTAEETVHAKDSADWAMFRARFISKDGRVIDNGQGGESHSEGQGYGMLLATYYGDKATFDLLLGWTEANLSRPNDHLAAWRFEPTARTHVSDMNNATDGDLYIAWALGRAATEWHDPAYAARGAAIAADILSLCVVEQGGKQLLLPAAQGFRHSEGTVVNLSYYAFPAFHELAKLVPSAKWAAVERDGLAVMDQARFGTYALPPDWLLVTPTGGYRPATGWPARFSWDAVRIPLNLSWAHLDKPALHSAVAMWTSHSTPSRAPAWVSLTGEAEAPYAVGPGVLAIAEVSAAEAQGKRVASLPSMADTTDYYQAALLLLAKASVADPEPMPPAVPEPEVADVVAPVGVAPVRVAWFGGWWTAADVVSAPPVAAVSKPTMASFESATPRDNQAPLMRMASAFFNAGSWKHRASAERP